MIVAHVAGSTRVLGQGQGYLGLPVRDEIRELTIGDETFRVRCMVTAWEPTPEEVSKIVAGAPVYLTVLGTQHPPVMLNVGDAPE